MFSKSSRLIASFLVVLAMPLSSNSSELPNTRNAGSEPTPISESLEKQLVFLHDKTNEDLEELMEKYEATKEWTQQQRQAGNARFEKTRKERRERVLELIQKADTEGTIEVIIQFKGPMATAAHTENSRAGNKQRAIVTATMDEGEAMLGRLGGRVIDRLKESPTVLAEVTAPILTKLLDDPLVDMIEPNRPLESLTDESFDVIGVDIGQSNRPKGAGSAVISIDSEIDAADFGDRIVNPLEMCFGSPGFCNEGSVGPGTATCTGANQGCLHGTVVANIAVGENGLASDAVVVPFRATQFQFALREALEEAAIITSLSNIAAVNVSLGYTGLQSGSSCFPMIGASIARLRQLGTAPVFATGNEGRLNEITVPACAPEAVAVGATHDEDGNDLTSCCNAVDDVWSGSNSSDEIDLLAPGAVITADTAGPGVTSVQGTSVATPHVTGAVAILAAAQPDNTMDQILDALKEEGTPIVDTRGQTPSNRVTPRINIDESLTFLQQTPNIVASILPNGRALGLAAGGNNTASAFGSITNTSGVSLSNCRLERPPVYDSDFTYQKLNPSTN